MANSLDLYISGATAFAVSVILTPTIIWTARRLRIFDNPGGYKAHEGSIPLLGGLSVACGMAAGIAWSLSSIVGADRAAVGALAVGGTIIIVAGLIDDIRGLSPRYKLAWQAGAATGAAVVLATLGVRLKLFLGWDPFPIVLLTVVWIVAVTNAVNFLDNMNGLCAGLGAIAAACLAAYNLRTGEVTVALAAAALAGACVGFLPYNWPKARIFLGDTGSMLIGLALAALCVMGVYTPGAQLPYLAVLSPLFVLAVPLLDAIVVICLRLRAGRPTWLGDRRHISHRLVRRGMQPASAVATLWAASAACGMGALLLPTVGSAEAPILVALLACALGALVAAAGTEGLP